METNVNYTIVGTFVILLISFIVIAIIWLTSGFNFEMTTNYNIYMQESVSGLSIDSQVEFNGVDVGSVKSIQLNKDNPHLVELLININSNTPVTTSTVATLSSRGVTGVTYIALKDGGGNLTPLVAAKGQRYPVIPTAPSLLVRIDTALSRLSVNLQEVTKAIQSVLDKDNQLAIKQTIKNIERITGTLAANDRHIAELLQNATQLTKSTTSSMSMLETQLLPRSYQLLSQLNDMSHNMSEVAGEIQQNPSILIRGKAPRALGPGEHK